MQTTGTQKTRRPRTPARGPGRLSAADTARMDAHLLDDAQALFVAQGYARTTMDAIARAAGVSRKTLYARYANKAEVLTAVVNRLLDASLAPASAVDAAPAAPSPARAPRTALLALALELARLSSAPQVAGLNRLALAEAVQVPELAQLFAGLYERAIDHVGSVLNQLHADGHLPHLSDVRLAATLFIEMSASVPRLRAMLGQPMPPAQMERQAEAATDWLLAATAGPPTATEKA